MINNNYINSFVTFKFSLVFFTANFIYRGNKTWSAVPRVYSDQMKTYIGYYTYLPQTMPPNYVVQTTIIIIIITYHNNHIT